MSSVMVTIITCNDCGKKRTFSGIVAHESLEKIGWQVDIGADRHMCPACIKKFRDLVERNEK